MLLPSLAILAGLILLVWSADRFVAGASATAQHFAVPPLLVGMLIVGFGTSAPEMVVSVLAASQGNPGLALGNAWGSNIVNMALILGITALIAPILVRSVILRKELPILMAVIAVTLVPLGSHLWPTAALFSVWGLLATAAPVGWWSWLARTFTSNAEAGGGLMVAVVQCSIALGSSRLGTGVHTQHRAPAPALHQHATQAQYITLYLAALPVKIRWSCIVIGLDCSLAAFDQASCLGDGEGVETGSGIQADEVNAEALAVGQLVFQLRQPHREALGEEVPGRIGQRMAGGQGDDGVAIALGSGVATEVERIAAAPVRHLRLRQRSRRLGRERHQRRAEVTCAVGGVGVGLVGVLALGIDQIGQRHGAGGLDLFGGAAADEDRLAAPFDGQLGAHGNARHIDKDRRKGAHISGGVHLVDQRPAGGGQGPAVHMDGRARNPSRKRAGKVERGRGDLRRGRHALHGVRRLRRV